MDIGAGVKPEAASNVLATSLLARVATWLQGDRRSRWLATTPLARVLFITPRPSMPPAIMAGQKPGNGTTDYGWFIWSRGHTGAPQIGWLRRNSIATVSQTSMCWPN